MFEFLKSKPKNVPAAERDKTPDEVSSSSFSSPAVAASNASPANGKYTVQPGDSLSKIAKKHGVSLSQILTANPQIKNPDLIHPQEVINLG